MGSSIKTADIHGKKETCFLKCQSLNFLQEMLGVPDIAGMFYGKWGKKMIQVFCP